MLQVVLGIGLVIFVHEAGHFIAARMCGVRVEVFSLGFGPRLFGWRRGDTLYQVALLPLGGFCKMAGEEFTGEETAPREGDLGSKSVGARFFIYSGGVIMNVVFGLVVFPIVLSIGVPFIEPTVGRTDPGSPAWHARIEPGTRVLSVNDNPVIGFMYIGHEIALGPPEMTRLEVLEPGSEEPRTILVEPEYNEAAGMSTIGVMPALDPRGEIVVAEGSPAHAAGLRSGDRIVAIESDLPEEPVPEALETMRRAEPLELGVQRDGERMDVTVVPEMLAQPKIPVLGVRTPLNLVFALRENPALAALGLQEGDRVRSVNGRPTLRSQDLHRGLIASEGPVRMVVDRDGREFELTGPALDRASALALASDIALRQDLQTNQVVVAPGSAAAEAGLRDGDRIARIDGAPIGTWEELYSVTRSVAKRPRELALAVERTGPDGTESLSLAVTPRPREDAFYGIEFKRASYLYRAPNLAEAFTVGFKGSWKFIVDSWMTLKRILLGQVSGENIGGIITIGVVSYSWASLGLPKLFFFLCILSLNLAFLNVLPIPVLDGGHLFFLLVEKIKGSPVSERVFGYSQMVGLVLILSLMIYVTFNDLRRWVFDG